MAARRTFVWLSPETTGRKRPPSEYEEVSTGVQWADEPVSRTEIGQWSPDSTQLQTDWNAFRDPQQMHYRNYVIGQDAAEKQLDSVYALATEADFVSGLPTEWRESLKELVGAMAFAHWGASMAMQHVMRFTLSPTVACAVQLQIMDKLRAAERSVEWFEILNPDADDDALHATWDVHPAVQPLRRFCEEILAERDWGQVIVAVNLALAGVLEPFLRELYKKGGRANGDFVTAALGSHLAKDASRAVAWTDAFLKQCVADEANRKVIADWLDRYTPAAVAAIDALVAAFPSDGVAAEAAAVAKAEASARIEKIDSTLLENIAAALASDVEPA
jgi:hypothetical protein